jgi:LacI family transcriptional regulator
MPPKKSTIKDVAKLADVSFKTVSRVINREPTVGEELRERVWAAARKLNYQPNLSARQMRGASSFIGFIYDNPNSHYVIEMQQGILDECRKQDFELVIHPCDATNPGVIDEVLHVVHRNQIGGLILAPPMSESARVQAALVREEVRTVRIISAAGLPEDDPFCIYVDDRGAAHTITRYLIELGHRRIAFLNGEREHHSSIQRLQGYRDALRDAGIPTDESLVLDGRYNFESGVQRTKVLLERQAQPTAVFAGNDEIAAGTLFAARLLGFAVPGDLSIVGFEDSPFSRQTWPRLSTARQPNQVIAQRATRLLIDTIRTAEDTVGPDERGFHPKLVLRDSTAPPARS